MAEIQTQPEDAPVAAPRPRALVEPLRWVDTIELAEILGTHPNTLSGWRTKGTGPKYSKRLGRVRYFTGDVDAWLRAGERTSTSDSKEAK